jgi:hypothetical protein
MQGKLILDRIEARESGERIFVFEWTEENGRTHFLTFAEGNVPASLVSALRQGDILSAEWNADAILSGKIEKEETKQAAKEADDLLQRLFAKGKNKK